MCRQMITWLSWFHVSATGNGVRHTHSGWDTMIVCLPLSDKTQFPNLSPAHWSFDDHLLLVVCPCAALGPLKRTRADTLSDEQYALAFVWLDMTLAQIRSSVSTSTILLCVPIFGNLRRQAFKCSSLLLAYSCKSAHATIPRDNWPSSSMRMFNRIIEKERLSSFSVFWSV